MVKPKFLIAEENGNELAFNTEREAQAIDIGVDDIPLPYAAEDVQEALEQTLNYTGVSRFALLFAYNGQASNKWLELFQSISSDTSPYVCAEDGEIKALSVAVKNSTTATFTIYVNGVSVDTITLTAATQNSKSGLSLALATNDAISAKITSGSARDIILIAHIQVTN